jgi:hypothetical protein
MHQLQGKHTLLRFTPIIWKGQGALNHGGYKHDPFGSYTCTEKWYHGIKAPIIVFV